VRRPFSGVTLLYKAHHAASEFSLHCLSAGVPSEWTLDKLQVAKGHLGTSNNRKIFTAPICNVSRLFHLFFQRYRKGNPGSFPEGAPVFLLKGFWQLQLSLPQAFVRGLKSGWVQFPTGHSMDIKHQLTISPNTGTGED